MERDDKPLVVNPLVVTQEAPDGSVLIDMATGECFELNRTGSKIWSLLAARESVARIVSGFASDHGLLEAAVESDVRSLIAELMRRGLVKSSAP